MIIEVMCRIADGPLRPGELEITQAAAPLVNWCGGSCAGNRAPLEDFDESVDRGFEVVASAAKLVSLPVLWRLGHTAG
jgi:hypothetical protein